MSSYAYRYMRIHFSYFELGTVTCRDQLVKCVDMVTCYICHHIVKNNTMPAVLPLGHHWSFGFLGEPLWRCIVLQSRVRGQWPSTKAENDDLVIWHGQPRLAEGMFPLADPPFKTCASLLVLAVEVDDSLGGASCAYFFSFSFDGFFAVIACEMFYITFCIYRFLFSYKLLVVVMFGQLMTLLIQNWARLETHF